VRGGGNWGGGYIQNRIQETSRGVKKERQRDQKGGERGKKKKKTYDVIMEEGTKKGGCGRVRADVELNMKLLCLRRTNTGVEVERERLKGRREQKRKRTKDII